MSEAPLRRAPVPQSFVRRHSPSVVRVRAATYLPLAAALAALAALPPARAAACSVRELRTSPGYAYRLERVADFVDSAEVIVRARVVGADSADGGRVVTFEPLEWMRGGASAGPLRVGGTLVEHDDYNPQPVPYTMVRPAGQRGDCFAQEYRRGAEYLLLLRGGTPYWMPLAPLNEQVRGADDPWAAWVRARATSHARDA